VKGSFCLSTFSACGNRGCGALRVWGEGLCSASLIELDRGSTPSGVFRPVGTAYGLRHSRGGVRDRGFPGDTRLAPLLVLLRVINFAGLL
jgi:hypothetical protein